MTFVLRIVKFVSSVNLFRMSANCPIFEYGQIEVCPILEDAIQIQCQLSPGIAAGLEIIYEWSIGVSGERFQLYSLYRIYWFTFSETIANRTSKANSFLLKNRAVNGCCWENDFYSKKLNIMS